MTIKPVTESLTDLTKYIYPIIEASQIQQMEDEKGNFLDLNPRLAVSTLVNNFNEKDSCSWQDLNDAVMEICAITSEALRLLLENLNEEHKAALSNAIKNIQLLMTTKKLIIVDLINSTCAEMSILIGASGFFPAPPLAWAEIAYCPSALIPPVPALQGSSSAPARAPVERVTDNDLLITLQALRRLQSEEPMSPNKTKVASGMYGVIPLDKLVEGGRAGWVSPSSRKESKSKVEPVDFRKNLSKSHQALNTVLEEGTSSSSCPDVSAPSGVAGKANLWGGSISRAKSAVSVVAPIITALPGPGSSSSSSS